MAAIIRGVDKINSFLTAACPHRGSKGKSKTNASPPARESKKTNIYALKHGVLCTRRSLVQRAMLRRSVTIVLAEDGAPFELTVGGKNTRYRAAVLRPLVRHSLYAGDVRTVSVLVNPKHPLYRAFRAIADPGVLGLERETFGRLEREINRAFLGGLDLAQGNRLFDRIVATVARILPKPKPIDCRIEKVLEVLDERPLVSLSELAGAVRLSRYRLSHLFTDELGISLRSYRLWWRIMFAGKLLDLGHTIAHAARLSGFGDVEYLCRMWRRTYGAPPSYFYRNPGIRFFSAWNPNRVPDNPAVTRPSRDRADFGSRVRDLEANLPRDARS